MREEISANLYLLAAVIPFAPSALLQTSFDEVAVGLVGRRQILFERNHRPVSHGHNLARTLFDMAAEPIGKCGLIQLARRQIQHRQRGIHFGRHELPAVLLEK